MSEHISEHIKVMENQPRALRVALMAFVGIAAALGSLWWSAHLLETYGINPGDGGVVRPFAERLTVAAITAGCGLAFAIGLLVFQGLYIEGISRTGNHFYVHSKIMCFNLIKRFELSDVASSRYSHKSSGTWPDDPYQTPRQHYLTMRIKGWWLPYIVDPQARHIDRAELYKIIPSAVSSWNSDPTAINLKALDL